MSALTMKTASGDDAGEVDLPETVFGIEPNLAVLHQVVTAQLAHRRAGTHSTKTRAEVAGGGAKPWRQKGTGRARQGSIRAPQWRGGGIAHGPRPRDHSQKINKKMVSLALRSALSDRAAEGKVVVVDDWGLDAPRTKAAVQLLAALGLRPADERAPRVLVVLFRGETAAWKSLRNLGGRVQLILPEELTAYDVLVNDYVAFSQGSVAATVARFTGEGRAVDPALGREPEASGVTAASTTKAAKAAKATEGDDGDEGDEGEV